MNIVFFGASSLGYKCCEALLEAGVKISGIFTIPETFDIKYKGENNRDEVKNFLFKDFGDFEKKFKIPVITVQGKLSEYIDALEKMNPDFILVVGWYYLIPQNMLNLASKGAAGIHGSLLPRYRGNAPFVWAIINGETETGVTFFYFDGGVDTGDIIDQKKIPIGENDTIKDLLNKAEEASIVMLLENIDKIRDGVAVRVKQNNEGASYFPRRTPADGVIDWTWSSKRVYNFIRAQTKPYPGAYTIINNKKVIIWEASIEDIDNAGLDLNTNKSGG